MENLRYMLSLYDPQTPIYFGHRFKKVTKQGYMSGGNYQAMLVDHLERGS